MIPPANTGRDSNNKITVINNLQEKRGKSSYCAPGFLNLMKEQMKLIPPIIDETPAKWREKIARSTESELLNFHEVKGGYKVHPTLSPSPEKNLIVIILRDRGNNQNLILFSRGKIISGAARRRGKSQLPKPPIKIGMTIKKIITNACTVTIELYITLSPNTGPQKDNSNRIKLLNLIPIIPPHTPIKMYRVPISL